MENHYVYHPSGVDWLEQLPENWNVVKWKYLSSERMMYGANESAELDDRDLPRYIRITDLDSQGNLKDETFKSLSYEKAKGYMLKNGDILLARSGATVGKAYIHKGDLEACFAGYLIRYRANENIVNPKLVYYYTQTMLYADWIRENTIQATIQNVSAEKYANLSMPVPPNQEQNNIVCFLDNKTSEIDSLIANKEKLIELLEEKRQATITEVVTKGLNPDVNMKDSNVDFIGQIPEHWELKKMKNLSQIESSNVDKKTVENETPVLLCNYVDVYYNDEITNKIEFMKATAKPEQIKNFTLKKNDVIITKDSESPLDIAIPTWVGEDLDGVLCGYHLALLRPKESVLNGLYLFYLLKSSQIREQFYSRANGVTRYGLSKEAIKNGLFPCPPLEEQLSIGAYLYEANNEISNGIVLIKDQINKLKEYRQSLIYEAVTGKIDVRDYKKVLS
ncbi:restriction endonuclease subunit S [Cytobacillus gottheilii]|uniref:restriction endonuclease subunit S n=1 Tax=Cytobacillus gottheilii TaxID=859144 RepID=UPI00082D1075|nr:restriction endonuclease subunit S [Cytobacillus gottheilii]